jgi:hypothetical protein
MVDNIKGVTQEKGRLRRKFKAVIRIDGILHHLGYYPTKEAAHEAYLKAKTDLQAQKNK